MKLSKIWTHELYNLKNIVNFLLVLVVTSILRSLKAFKMGITKFLQHFERQHISTNYESRDKN